MEGGEGQGDGGRPAADGLHGQPSHRLQGSSDGVIDVLVTARLPTHLGGTARGDKAGVLADGFVEVCTVLLEITVHRLEQGMEITGVGGVQEGGTQGLMEGGMGGAMECGSG